jgi:hypothetical protein
MRIFSVMVLLACGVLLHVAAVAYGQEKAKPDARLLCPTPMPCKILILTTEEEQAMLGPRGILDTAEQGRPLDLLGAVKFFRDKIAKAPAGEAP